MKIKKLLLTTTAFATALCMQSAFAGPAKYSKSKPKAGMHAHSPLHINFWGWLDTQAGFRSQKSKHRKDENNKDISITKNNRNVAFDTTGSLRTEVKGKTSKGLMYGANIDVTVDINTNTNSTDQNNNNNFAKMNRTFIYMQDKDMGRLEMGNNDGAAGTMLPTANDVGAATGGIGGDWSKYVVITQQKGDNSTNERNFHMNSGSLLDQSGTLPAFIPIQKPRKLTYYTPEHDTGLELGLSYVPDASNVKDPFRNTTAQNENTFGYKDGFSGGINWNYKISKDNKIKLGLVGEYATVQKEAKNNYSKLGSVGIGIYHMYQDLCASASFNYLGKSGLRKGTGVTNLKAKKGNYVATLGVGYNIDNKTKISLTGLISQKWKNKFLNASLGVQYKLAPGLLPYAEVTYFNMKQKYRNVNVETINDGSNDVAQQNTAKNRGASFIIGTRLAF
ncbi:MAG: hypothetical protein HRU36_05050 [Rickettsiales bacterium]|nr:hypothetical protein [Rickettsiales bacterium]